MPTTIYKGISEDRLQDLINLDNPRPIRVGIDFIFGTPQPYSDDEGRNTRVALIANPEGPYSNDEVFYTRLPISVLHTLPEELKELVVIPSLPTDIHTLLPSINESLGLDLSVDEVLNTNITEKDTEYTLTIVEGSLAWLASEYEFSVHHAEDSILLSDVLTTTEIMGPSIEDIGIDINEINYLFELINYSQDVDPELNASIIDITEVKPNDNDGVGNTRVTLLAKNKALPIVGSVDVTYDRINIEEVFDCCDNEFELQENTSPQSLVTLINYRFNTDFKLSDFEVFSIPELTNELSDLMIEVRTDSVLYYGQKVIKVKLL